MRKVIPFLLIGGVMLGMASCKEEKKTEDIITRIPHKKTVKTDTEKMSEFTYHKRVKAFGDTLDIYIHRFPDTSLPQVVDEKGRKHFDNKIDLLIKRADGSVFINRTFSKEDFSEFTNNAYGEKGVLLGFMFDKIEGNSLRFGASVGSPDPTSDEYVPIEALIDARGKMTLRNEANLDSDGEQRGKAQPKQEADEDGV